VIQDERLEALLRALPELEAELERIIGEQQRAAEEKANESTLKSIQRAFREAMLSLPDEDYDWFDIRKPGVGRGKKPASSAGVGATAEALESLDGEAEDDSKDSAKQAEFFEHAGPLHSVRVSPASATMTVGTAKPFRAVARDRSGRSIDSDINYAWHLAEGDGQIENATSEIARFLAPDEPQLARLAVRVKQENVEVEAEALITITTSLLPETSKTDQQRGLPDYTFEKRPGELWRSRFDVDNNVIVVNNGHRDFVYASRSKAIKLRYICRLYAKELVQHNFPGCNPNQLLERMIELLLYTEENLR
jgi:hypothetical protein